jgi:hypothetical protein
MKVTVSEALRLKNEISKKITALAGAFTPTKSGRYSFMESSPTAEVSHGVTTEDGEVVSSSSAITSVELELKISKLYDLSQKINSVLTLFNAQSGVSDAVRERQNTLSLLLMYELFSKNSVPTANAKFEVVGAERKKITVAFRPHLTQDHIALKVAELKNKIRSLQQVVDVANGQQLEIPFEYSDLEGV